MWGWVLIAIGVIILINVISGFTHSLPSGVWGWILQLAWIAGGSYAIYRGYQMEYPPPPTLFTGGRSKWY